jgi:putative hydrolase of the HAD superfamily
VTLLLCDLDDTVLDRVSTFRVWARGFAAAHGQGDGFVAWLIERDGRGYSPRAEFFAAIRQRLALTTPVEDLVADFYRDFAPLFRLDAGVRRALIDVRRRGWRLAIVTNGSPTQVEKIKHSGLDALVDTWCVSSIEGHRKPEVRLLEIAAQRCGEELAGAWLVGDGADTDIAAAHRAGIGSVWLRHGGRWSRDDFEPTFEADSFADAVDLVLAERNYESR